MTAEPAALLALAASVEAGDGPDRQLDARIEGLIGPESETPGSHLLGGFTGGRRAWLLAYSPPYTVSADDALALLREVLPGCCVSAWCKGDQSATVELQLNWEWIGRGEAPTLPRAIVAAVCRAMAGRG